MRKLAADKYGYYHTGGQFGAYHQLRLMLDVAQDMEKICPNAWLIQSGNPVFDGCTLMTRETSIKVCGLCHGHYHYREIAETIGIDPDRVTWQAPGLNHNIWLTHFIYEGKNAYPLIDEWIATKGEEYWRTHVADADARRANVARRGASVSHVRSVPDWRYGAPRRLVVSHRHCDEETLVRRALGRTRHSPRAPVLCVRRSKSASRK